jgi:hypothetical protein
MAGASVAAVQVAVLAVVFLAAGVAKLHAAMASEGSLVTGVAVLARPGRHRMIAAGLGTVEAVVGLGLLLSPAPALRWSAFGLLAAALGVAGYLKRFRPDAGCGCFGALSTAPVRWPTIARTGLLLLAAAAAVLAPPRAGLALLGGSAGEQLLLVAELALLAVASPELWDRFGQRWLLRAADQAELALDCAVRRVPQEHTLRALHASREWRAHAGLLVSAQAADGWREGCWRFYAYDGLRAGSQVQVVFAVHLDGQLVKVAVVDASSDTVLVGANAAPAS